MRQNLTTSSTRGYSSFIKKILLCFCFAAHALYLQSQTLPNRRYTTRDGLVADRVTVITQDEEGFMWMGSLFGLSRYDGTRFTTIKLPALQQNKYVTSLIAVDKKVYAGFLFGGGLMQYDKGRISAFTMHPSEEGIQNDVTGLFPDTKGLLVCSGLNGVYRFYDQKFEHLFSLDSTYPGSCINALVRDNKGRIWVATPKGIDIFENGKLRRGNMTSPVFMLQKTSAGIVAGWSKPGTFSYSLLNDDQQGRIIYETDQLRPIPYSGLHPDMLWGIDNRRGIFNMSASGAMTFYASVVQPSSEVKYLFADRENNLWMANDPGLLKISNIPAISFEFEELAPGGSNITRSADSTIWCTNSKYLYRIKNNKLQKMPDFRRATEGGYMGTLITDAQNNLWISGWHGGLWKLHYKNDQLVHKEYINEYQGHKIDANSMISDDEGNTWTAGSYGIFHIRNGRIIDHLLPTRKDGSRVFTTAFTGDFKRKELWLGDNVTGIIRISYAFNGDKCTYKVLDHFDATDGLTAPNVRSLLFDSKDNLWIGTRLGGIFRMRRKDGGGFWFQNYGSSNGISCTRVTGIAEEKNEAVWFATCDGIFRFSLSKETWESYNVSDGLLGSEIFGLTLDEKSHHVWAVSGSGITSMRYGAGRGNRPPPQINITQVSILGQEDTAALLLQHPKKLSADENSIGFSFAGASYTDEKKIRYRYMLEGYDRNWSLPVQNNNVNYASLPFGHYTFKVLASNGDTWSEQPDTFSFQVVRPFYKSFWFIALIICVVVASLYFVRVYRLKQRLKLEKLRVNIARDLHDDIGSALGSINLLSENATRRLTTTRSVEEVAGVFQKIGHSAQSMLDSMDDIIWTINPEKDSLGDLLIRMREFAIPLLEAKNISFDINMHAADGVKPSMEIKRNIYLVFKEAIFNVVRHSGSSHVSIKALFGSKSFDLVIADNGKGFNINTLNGRNGLKNMKKRADLSGASLQIDSAAGAGTTIHFHGIIR